MTDIIGSLDCGNSPKNTFVQGIAIELESGAGKAEHFAENVVWTRPFPAEQIVGRAALIKAIATKNSPAKIIVEHAISHGKVGVANGEVTLPDGQSYRFCHVIAFTNAKANCVASVTSYGRLP